MRLQTSIEQHIIDIYFVHIITNYLIKLLKANAALATHTAR